MKVLIAEDDVISSRALEKTISDWNYEVSIAKDGEEAWNIIKKTWDTRDEKQKTNIAILDWEMPKMDGVELCRKIRHKINEKNSNYIYIVLLTGRDKQEDIIKGLSVGADDYITKPFNPYELKVRLKNGERIVKLQDSSRKEASIDILTKHWNRKKILECLNEEIERGSRRNHPIGIILADVDHFKNINDTHGHLIGDQVLIEVVTRLNKSMRKYDQIGRYGGDEFLAVIPHCDHTQISKIAKRLLRTISREKIQTEKGPLKITVSIGGISTDNFPQASQEDFIKASDIALYLAKQKGRNRVEIATDLSD